MVLLPLAALISAAVCSPVISQYRYVHSVNASKEIRRPDYSTPVTFNNVSIGTKALDETAESGTIHALTDGHHFFQKDWFLTSTNGGSWVYLPNLRETFTAHRKRQTAEMEIAWNVYNGNIGPLYVGQGLAVGEGGLLETVESVFAEPDLTEIGWDVISDTASDIIIDFIDDGAFITSSTAFIGDLVDIFVNALDIFF
ncbi:hypothetical protein F5884DRAFT_861937 [Xylogone sp. PMI_703]|nr:hypothetical protein F5884DRAFT_861937 [Xylogone sp. PMI_703]